MSDVIIRPIDIERDLEGLVDMWNASDLQWPGSWNNGVPTTAAMVREWFEEDRQTVIYVAEIDGEIAGYCSFEKGFGNATDEGYLGLLNVAPQFQKRSIGRKLIQATIERSVQEGWKRQSLDTWTANFKAVPTYKKTGHFWAPDSAVLMQNYIPGALQMPLAKPFFARHDWYDSYVRALEQGEDDERWEGIKVYTQHWEAEGEALTIWIDREARAPVAIETDAVQVAAIAADCKPLAGEPVTLRWRVINKGAQPLPVYLHALGDKGLSIDHSEAFVVPAGETVERSAPVQVEPDASSEKNDGTAPAVRSLFGVGDAEVELFSGLRVRKPLRIDTAPSQLSLTPGVVHGFALQLHNERPESTTVTLLLTPPEGLTLDWGYKQVTVPAKAHLSLPLSAAAAEERIYALPVTAAYADAERKPVVETLTLYAIGAGGLLAQRVGDDVRVETEAARVLVQAKKGDCKFEDKVTGVTLAKLAPVMGPPYWPSDFQTRAFDLQVSERGGRAVVTMSAEAEHAPGLHLTQELTLAPTGIMTLRCWLENRAARAHTRRVCVSLFPDYEYTTTTLPLPLGMVHGGGGEYPIAWADAPRDPAGYREPWRCWERQGCVLGVGWDDSLERIWGEWWLRLGAREVLVAPGERCEVLRLGFYVAAGDWRAARRALLGWRGIAAGADPGETRPAAMARIEPAVLATTARRKSATLRVDTASNRASDGQVSLHTAAGLTVTPAHLGLSGLHRDTPVVQPVTLALTDDRLGVYRGEAHLRLDLQEARKPFALLRLGTGTSVRVSQSTLSDQAVWVIDNGAAEFVVAPDYGPSLIAWNVGGVNQLCSTFPTPQGFSWRYPTYGGLHPLLYPAGSQVWTGYLHREQVTAEPVERRDADDLCWQGVRLAVQPTYELLKGVAVEVDLLTLGGSNVLQSIVRVRNLWDAEQRVNAGYELCCNLGGPPSELIQYGAGRAHRPTNNSSLQMNQPWGALSNQYSGRTMLLVSKKDDVVLEDTGQAGRLLGVQRELRLAADQVCELVSYVVLAESIAVAKGYLALKYL